MRCNVSRYGVTGCDSDNGKKKNVPFQVFRPSSMQSFNQINQRFRQWKKTPQLKSNQKTTLSRTPNREPRSGDMIIENNKQKRI
jgi:hypothetical protein